MARSRRTPATHRTCLRVEALEDRSVPAVSALNPIAPPSPQFQQALSDIKTAEAHLDGLLPTHPRTTIFVGTFDAAYSNPVFAFEGLKTKITPVAPDPTPVFDPSTQPYPSDYPPDPFPLLHPPVTAASKFPHVIATVPTIHVDAVNASLAFSARNTDGVFSVTINGGGPQYSLPGEDTLTVDVGRTSVVHWQISANGRTWADTLNLDFPAVFTAGTFTVPVVPIGIVYAPPAGSSHLNYAQVTQTQTASASIGVTLGDGTSTTQPSDTQFTDINTLRQTLDAAGGALQKVADYKAGDSKTSKEIADAIKAIPYVGTVASALQVIADGLGSASGSTTQSTVNAGGHSLTETVTFSQSFQTDPSLGQGAGDIIRYLKNATFVWVAQPNKMQLALVSATQAQPTVDVLQKDLRALNAAGGTGFGPITGLDRASILQLLALDPFAAGDPNAWMPPERFQLLPGANPLEVYPGTRMDQSFEHTVQTTDQRTSTNSTANLTDLKAGWLKAIGLGVDETKTTQVTVSTSVVQTTGDGRSDKVGVHLEEPSTAGKGYELVPYWDNQFDTIAYRATDIQQVGQATGLARLTPSQPQVVVAGPIAAEWAKLGGAGGLLGKAVQQEKATPDGKGSFIDFQNGSICYSPATGAHEVHGLIRVAWNNLGGAGGFLGMPLTDETPTPDGVGRYNHFQGGSVYWTPQTGAHEVHGAIRSKWASLGWERSFLGYPVTNETPTPDGVGRYNHFQGGSVYWTPQTGAHEVHGAIRDKWASLGWERSALGYPVSDETAAADGVGRYSLFQGGVIYWSSQTGAHALTGAIRAYWAGQGGERGPLGYPIGDVITLPGGWLVQWFRGGVVTWSAATGAHVSQPVYAYPPPPKTDAVPTAPAPTPPRTSVLDSVFAGNLAWL